MKVGICHYRVGRTDGVSLEIEKRKQILEKMGHQVSLIAGPQSEGADHVIPELEFDHPEIKELKENLFSFFHNQAMEWDEIEQGLDYYAEVIEQQLHKIQKKEQLEALLVHNIFSHGRHLSAAKAFYNFIREYRLPTISTNHDYYWERPEYADLRFHEIHSFLDSYVPPDDPLIKYVSINSISGDSLFDKRGIASHVIPDVFDFSRPVWELDEFNNDFLEAVGIKKNDIVVLQATRISPRKGIELAVEFVKELAELKSQLVGKSLYNGKEITEDSDVVLVLAGYAENECVPYMKQIEDLVKKTKVKAHFIHDIIAAERFDRDPKIYSLWDSYVFADLVTYPSLLEGWGNQFIEAIFAKKPVLLFEYPVFKKDIKSEGYSYISLGDKISQVNENGLVEVENKYVESAAQQAVDILLNPKTHKLLQDNFRIGKKYHDYQRIKTFLQEQF